uniref:Hexosyltransferase n=1 Tax=Caenorhabditis japonica TaxID=281687 RepID=A0A8R1E1E9_CAEJA
MPTPPANQDATPKVTRTRFAATELGTRERIMAAVMAESALALSINATLGRHVPRVHLFADSSRIDNDLAQLTNLSPYKLNGQKAHSMVLGLLFNMTVHESYDWFLLAKDSTYINPFVLLRMIDTMNWNEPVVMGEAAEDGSGRCRLDTGMLLSNPAMQILLKQRNICNLITSPTDDDQLAFEKCIQAATNLTCKTLHQGIRYEVWRGAERADSPAAHDSIEDWKHSKAFSRALAVPRLLSDADASALHDYFVRVEMQRADREISKMEAELSRLAEDEARETGEAISWPPALPPYAKPPNRYQVPTWEYFTMTEIFRSEPNQNVRRLEGKDFDDVAEVVVAARQQVETEEPELEFVQLRNGYRVFDPRRGMDYMIDLTYRKTVNEMLEMENQGDGDGEAVHEESLKEIVVERRVHVSRMIASTQLMNQAPYVKEDTDVTVVIPVAIENEVLPARKLLARQARLCLSPTEETRKTRMVVAVFPEVDTRSVTAISNDMEELKRRCKRSLLETDVLSVRLAASTAGQGTVAAAALDDAVDRYGANTIYLLLSPHADVQKEFYDRARINTIKHYQVFFPVPFVEYHPTISGMEMTEKEEKETSTSQAREAALSRLRDGVEPKRKRALIVQKDHGRFDSQDFSCFAVYGVDYVAARAKLGPSDRRNDLIAAFLGQDAIHVLRAVEPTLRIRYHKRHCDMESVDTDDIARCLESKKENVAAKDQLAKLLFHEK